MYQLYYNVIAKQFAGRCKMLYTDTDSFFMWLKSENLTEELQKIEQYFDFSSKSQSDPLYSTARKAEMGLLKDEMGSARGEEVFV